MILPVDKKLIKRLAALEKDKPINLRVNAVSSNYWFCLINGRNAEGPFKTRGEVYDFIEANPQYAEQRPVYKRFNLPLKFPCPYCNKNAIFEKIVYDDIFFNCGKHHIKWN